MRTAIALLLSLGCGAAQGHTTTEPPPPSAEAPLDTTPEPAAEDTARGEPALAVPARPRAIVDAPADLGAAIAARLPTIELVPAACPPPEPGATVSVTDERVCVFDVAGRTRAMRRFATSREPAVYAARAGDDVVFGVVDPGDTTTRYDRRVWRWELGADRYTGLIGGGDLGYWVSIDETSFGALIRTEDHQWVFDAGSHAQVRFTEISPPIFVVGETTYVTSRSGQRETLSTLRRDGRRLLLERVTRYPVTERESLIVRFPDGTPLIVSGFPHGDTTTLHVVSPPATEVRELVVPVRRPREAHWVNGTYQLRTDDGVVSVDLASGALTEAPAWSETSASLPGFRSYWSLGVTDDGVGLRSSAGIWTLSAAGVSRTEGEEVPTASGCRCTESALRCAETEIPLACTDVAELERVEDPYAEGRDPSTRYSPRYRLDRLEPDLARVTRLTDGARLWVRISDGDVLLAQADDGAFATSGELDVATYSVRWGRDLLAAPVSALEPVRAQLERPTLIADFFAGRPLPAADTTLP